MNGQPSPATTPAFPADHGPRRSTVPTHFNVALVRLAVVGAVLLTSVAIGATPASGVADGTPAAPGEYPFAVKLVMTHIPRPDGTFYNSGCSATLISRSWIITAGHCFHDVNRVPVSGPVPYVTAATLNTVDVSQSPGEVRNVTYVRQAGTTDIAVARLSAPVTDVTPLALNRATPAPGTVLTIAGWGATTSINPTPSTRLVTGQVKIQTVNPTTITVVGYHPEPDTSACLYDSGAPYFSTPTAGRPLLVAVESNGPDCPHSDPETTARVDTLINSIATTVPDLR
jgi:secreted trypsin-like serine protease